MTIPTRAIELTVAGPVAGVDEVGRGPLVGDVVAAAVILPDETPAGLERLRDSKAMTAKAREKVEAIILQTCTWSIGAASPAEIDEINILQATFLAMRRAVAGLKTTPGHLLIDGNRTPAGLPCPATAIIKGDAISLSIAAASVIAKCHRDRQMVDLDVAHPGYGWARNAGYGTKEHRDAIRALGPTIHHRRSFSWGDASVSTPDLFAGMRP